MTEYDRVAQNSLKMHIKRQNKNVTISFYVSQNIFFLYMRNVLEQKKKKDKFRVLFISFQLCIDRHNNMITGKITLWNANFLVSNLFYFPLNFIF